MARVVGVELNKKLGDLMLSEDDTPLLSLIVSGRNDDYQLDWLRRFEYVTNYNLKALRELGFDKLVDYHIVDFLSEEKIKNGIALAPSRTKIFIHEVDPDDTIYEDFNISYSLNVGLSKANGDYLMVIGSDQFMPIYSWFNLINFLREAKEGAFDARKLLQCPRMQLDTEFSIDDFSYTSLSSALYDVSLTNFRNGILKPALGTGAGALCLPKDVWASIGFLTASFSGHGGNDLDLMSKVSNQIGHADLGNWGSPL